MIELTCDYCGRAYRLDEHDPDNPVPVFGESKCKYCGKPTINGSEEHDITDRKETRCIKSEGAL